MLLAVDGRHQSPPQCLCDPFQMFVDEPVEHHAHHDTIPIFFQVNRPHPIARAEPGIRQHQLDCVAHRVIYERRQTIIHPQIDHRLRILPGCSIQLRQAGQGGGVTHVSVLGQFLPPAVGGDARRVGLHTQDVLPFAQDGIGQMPRRLRPAGPHRILAFPQNHGGAAIRTLADKILQHARRRDPYVQPKLGVLLRHVQQRHTGAEVHRAAIGETDTGRIDAIGEIHAGQRHPARRRFTAQVSDHVGKCLRQIGFLHRGIGSCIAGPDDSPLQQRQQTPPAGSQHPPWRQQILFVQILDHERADIRAAQPHPHHIPQGHIGALIDRGRRCPAQAVAGRDGERIAGRNQDQIRRRLLGDFSHRDHKLPGPRPIQLGLIASFCRLLEHSQHGRVRAVIDMKLQRRAHIIPPTPARPNSSSAA